MDWEALGRALREAREQAGTPPDIAARQLCLGKNQILALENGTSASFPGAEARAWCARRYAGQLGLTLEDFGRDPARSARLPEAIPAEVPPAYEEPPTPADEEDVSAEARQPIASGIGKRIAIALLMLVIAGLISLSRPPAPQPVVKAAPMVPLTPPAPEPATPPAAPPEPEAAQPETPPAAPAPTKSEPAALSAPSVEIAGIDAHKSSTTVFVAARESVLLIAQRPGRGEIRYPLEQGGAQRIPVAEGELLRVAQGKELDMFFQGRKVAASVIEAGQWLRFVPLKPAATP